MLRKLQVARPVIHLMQDYFSLGQTRTRAISHPHPHASTHAHRYILKHSHSRKLTHNLVHLHLYGFCLSVCDLQTLFAHPWVFHSIPTLSQNVYFSLISTFFLPCFQTNYHLLNLSLFHGPSFFLLSLSLSANELYVSKCVLVKVETHSVHCW